MILIGAPKNFQFTTTFNFYSNSEAVETRHALHGVRWPTSNPKCLNVDFGRAKDMEKAIMSTLEDNSRTLTTTDAPKETSGGFGWSKADAFRIEVEQKSAWVSLVKILGRLLCLVLNYDCFWSGQGASSP